MEPLPSWAAQLEPVGFNWSVRGEQECNTSVAPAGLPNDFQPLKEPQKSSASCWTTNSNAGMSSKLSDQSTQDLMSIENQGQCWDPTPSMPEMDQEEALEFMSDYGLVGDQPAAEQGVNEDPAGLTQLAPATSDIDSAEGDSKATHDDSKLARSRGQPYTAEQKQVKARESQKRFRMRQKARSQAIEAQLASTAAELRSLKQRQQQLETRNQLLEKFSHLGKEQTQLDRDGLYERLYIVHETDARESGPSITISVNGESHSMTVQEISQMPLKQFAFLWTKYVRKIGACLVQLEQAHDSKVKTMMETLTNESSRLVGCIKLLNHSLHQALLMGKMDDSLSNSHKLGGAFYTNLSGISGSAYSLRIQYVARALRYTNIREYAQCTQSMCHVIMTCLQRMMNLTELQRQDYIYLRRIYLTRRYAFAMARQALLAQAAINRDQMPLPSDNLSHIQDLAAALQKNATEDYRVYHRVACAARRGVMTTKQWAILIVQSYPYLPQLEVHLEAVAAEGGAPTKAQILAAAQSNPMMREWQHLNKYLESVASKNSGEHTPLFERAVKAGVVSSEPTSGPLANSKHLASNSSSLMGAGHMQRGNASGQVQFNQDTGYGLPGLLDLYGGTSDSTTPAFDAGLNIVQTMSAPVGQAGAPANMLCGSTSVPFRLDPAVAAIPPMPASYQQDPAYMFRNEFMLQQPSVAAGVQQRGAFKQHEAGNAFRSSVPMPFAPDAAGTLPFSLPHMH